MLKNTITVPQKAQLMHFQMVQEKQRAEHIEIGQKQLNLSIKIPDKKQNICRFVIDSSLRCLSSA